jgi:hypothetical protein
MDLVLQVQQERSTAVKNAKKPGTKFLKMDLSKKLNARYVVKNFIFLIRKQKIV